ncbi:branchpoint-bridging protein-like [Lutra lutra]|uniref:branchpoint-bridging protein-like n=1 Tax=Lutra lutra TaxID=9657 RepID=UPI001FD379A5|nr:branchpoint-bridging protein-like [Lutra lutra]
MCSLALGGLGSRSGGHSASPGPSPAPARDVLLSSASCGAEGLPIFTQRMPRKTSSSPRLAQNRSRDRRAEGGRAGVGVGVEAHQRRTPWPGAALSSGRASSSSSELPRTEPGLLPLPLLAPQPGLLPLPLLAPQPGLLPQPLLAAQPGLAPQAAQLVAVDVPGGVGDGSWLEAQGLQLPPQLQVRQAGHGQDAAPHPPPARTAPGTAPAAAAAERAGPRAMMGRSVWAAMLRSLPHPSPASCPRRLWLPLASGLGPFHVPCPGKARFQSVPVLALLWIGSPSDALHPHRLPGRLHLLLAAPPHFLHCPSRLPASGSAVVLFQHHCLVLGAALEAHASFLRVCLLGRVWERIF